jgi:hypothetical protein
LLVLFNLLFSLLFRRTSFSILLWKLFDEVDDDDDDDGDDDLGTSATADRLCCDVCFLDVDDNQDGDMR